MTEPFESIKGSVAPIYLVPITDTRPGDSVDVAEVFALLWERKFLILLVAMIGGGLAFGISFATRPIYRSEVLMVPSEDEKGGGALSSIANQFGGLASLAGIQLPSSSNSSATSIAILGSRMFIARFIRQRNLMPILYASRWDDTAKTWKSSDPAEQPTMQRAVQYFSKKVFNVKEDKKTGTITVLVDWRDPVLAAEWANSLVGDVNNQIRLRAISEAKQSLEFLNKELEKTDVVELRQSIYKLIETQVKTVMVANIRPEYAFKVLDPAIPSDADHYVKPKRLLMAVLGFFAAGLVAVIFTLRASRRSAA